MTLARRLLLFLSLIFIVRVYSGSYDAMLSDYAQSLIVAYKVPCKFSNLGIAPPFSLKAEGLSCQISNPKENTQPISFSVHKVEISPAWKELLSFSLGIKLMALPLAENKGGLSITVSRSIWNGRSKTSLNLNKFPVGSFLKTGVIPGLAVDGELAGDLDLIFSKIDDLAGQGSILFERGLLSASGMERSIIKLPVLKEVSIQLPVIATNKMLKFSPIIGASSFGVLKGDGSVKNLSSLPILDFNGRLVLNEVGMKAVGGFVALMAGVDLSKPVEEWNISISGEFGRQPVVKVSPVN